MAVAAFSLLAACNDPDELGLGLLPSTDELGVFTTDTVKLYTTTVNGDSLPTNRAFQAYLLGSYTDPVFGRTDASIYGQLGLSNSPSFGDSGEILTADSLVLSLEYLGPATSETVSHYYGNLNTPLKITVYRLTEAMSVDSTYYSNRTFATEAQPIGSGTIIPSPRDSVSIGGVKTAPHFRIRLSDQLAAELLSLNRTDVYASTTNWLNYFKGVYIKTEPVNGVNEGSICQFNLGLALGRPLSSMTLYFHSDTPGDDSLKYSYPFNAARTQYFAHSNASFDAGRQVQDPSYNDSLTYLQSMSGVRTKIEMPSFDNLKTLGTVVVNKAELVIPAQYLTTEVYSPPSKLNLVALLEDGTYEAVVDYTATIFFGGSYDATNHVYKFNIARHMQSVLDGERKNYGFYVTVPYIVGASGYANIQPNRVILSSAKNVSAPVKLNVSYTLLD